MKQLLVWLGSARAARLLKKIRSYRKCIRGLESLLKDTGDSQNRLAAELHKARLQIEDAHDIENKLNDEIEILEEKLQVANSTIRVQEIEIQKLSAVCARDLERVRSETSKFAPLMEGNVGTQQAQ